MYTSLQYFLIIKLSTVRDIKCGITEENRNAYRDLVGKNKRKTPDLKIRRRWADIISIILKIYGSNEEWHSTGLSAVAGPMSSSNKHVSLQCFMLDFLSCYHITSAFEICKPDIVYKIIFMVTPCINDISPFLVQLMHLCSLLKQD